MSPKSGQRFWDNDMHSAKLEDFMSPKSGQRFWDNDMHSAKLEDFMSSKSGQQFWDNDMHSAKFERAARNAHRSVLWAIEIEGDSAARNNGTRAAVRIHPRAKGCIPLKHVRRYAI
jgi:hypothetical protein